MIKLIQALVGLKTSQILAVYFQDGSGKISNPISLIVVSGSVLKNSFEPDGVGGVKENNQTLEKIYCEPSVGFSFIAPLLVSTGGALDGDETIVDHSVIPSEGTYVRFRCTSQKYIDVRFVDDEMYVSAGVA